MPRLTYAGKGYLLVVATSMAYCFLSSNDTGYSIANEHLHHSLNSTPRSGTKQLDSNNSWIERINLKVISQKSAVLPEWDMLEVRQIIVEAPHVIPTQASSGHALKLGPRSYFMLAYSEIYQYGVPYYELLQSFGISTKDKYIECPMRPVGIAAACDWALMVPCLYADLTIEPRTIYVHHVMLEIFIEQILKHMPVHTRFVLVTSGTDHTIPTASGDVRFYPMRGFSNVSSERGGPHWQVLTHSVQLVHWFCENHDINDDRVSTLPTGIVKSIEGMSPVPFNPAPSPLRHRPLRFLVAHRTRSMTGQWKHRQIVTNMCLKLLLTDDLCLYPSGNLRLDHRKSISQRVWIRLASSVPFVLCVHGGGLDPSPKAWEAIMLGTIPIIQHSTLDDAYAQLPVVFVNSWQVLFEGNLTAIKSRLQGIVEALSPYYDDPILRGRVVEKLKMKYWLDLILSTHAGVRANITRLAVEFEEHVP